MSARRDGALMAPLLALALVALGTATLVSSDRFKWVTLLCLTTGLVATLLGVLAGGARHARPARPAEDVAAVVLGAGLVWQLLLLAVYAPGIAPRPSRPWVAVFLAGIAAALLVSAAELTGVARLARWRLPLLVAVHAVIGTWIIATEPYPWIDVYVYHVEALQALADGANPYTITIPDIYGTGDFYGTGIVVDGRVQVGFPYPPLSLLVSGAGYLLGGDYRFANLAALGGAALLIGACRPGRVVAAAVVLFTPRTFFVLEQGWTDPYVALLLAATVWCACRRPALLPLALGLFFAIKQYTLLAAPLVVLLHAGPTPWRDTARTLGKAALVAAVITLPFALWNPRAFVVDLLWFQVQAPFRWDALSFLAAWARATGTPPPAWIGFALVPPAIALGLWRAPRTPAGFAAAAALTFLVFFAFGKQAFANYYITILAALGCALGARDSLTPPAGSA